MNLRHQTQRRVEPDAPYGHHEYSVAELGEGLPTTKMGSRDGIRVEVAEQVDLSGQLKTDPASARVLRSGSIYRSL